MCSDTALGIELSGDFLVQQKKHLKEYDAQMRANCNLSVSSQVSHLLAASPAEIMWISSLEYHLGYIFVTKGKVEAICFTFSEWCHHSPSRLLRILFRLSESLASLGQPGQRISSWLPCLHKSLSANLPLMTAIMWRSSESVNISKLSASWYARLVVQSVLEQGP